MNVEEALLTLFASTSPGEFEVRRALLKRMILADPQVLRTQMNLLERRATVAAGRKAMAAENQAMDDKTKADEAWVRAVAAPMFTESQRKFIRQGEFLMYMKLLDGLILSFDRSNTFNLVDAVDTTTKKLTQLRSYALDLRETLGGMTALLPSLPRTFFAREVRGTFLRYIRWQAALDLDK